MSARVKVMAGLSVDLFPLRRSFSLRVSVWRYQQTLVSLLSRMYKQCY